jgi:enoyl-CoA hydratase/carnithine racemase
MSKYLTERTESDLLLFTINRKAIRNAIDFEVMDGLMEVINTVRNDTSIKALLITGCGNEAFCSGGDLSVFHELHTKEQAYLMLSKMGNILYELLTLNRPTVAILNGTAIGGGCELATACDFRIAKAGTKFGFVQGRLSITTGWGGGTMLMEKLPYDQASYLLYSAQTFSVEVGKEKGFIHKVLNEPEWSAQGMKWVSDLVEHSSSKVLSAYKQIAINRWDAMNVRDRMLEEIKQCSILWESEEHHEAVSSFLKRKST